ncbi:hypothetical protein V8C42DRAFT_322225 [Trichoderma barbatum]
METPLPNIPPIGSRDEDVTMRDSPAAAVIDSAPIANPDTENGSAPSSTPRPSYTPQFSSASWILDRVKNDQGPSSSNLPTGSEAPRAEEEKKDVPNGQDGSSIRDTLAMPISPTHQPFGSVANMIAAGSQLIGMKRKREQGDEADDFTQNTMSLPMPAPPPAVKSSAVGTLSSVPSYSDTKCSKCDETILESHNPLIPCSRCSRLWHQECASSAIKEEDIQQASRFMCPSCLSIGVNDLTSHGTPYSQQQNEIERRRAKNLATLPDDVVPARAEHVGFWAGHTSDAALTEYFYGKKKTDVLNILSFCDQLKPQLLVDIMVSVAKKHPDLPMFDSPSWNAKAMSAISARAKHSHSGSGSRSATRIRHGHTVLESRVKHKHKASKKTIKITSIPQEEESPVMDFRDSLPPMWPKAGEGLYAKLSPEDEDRAFLLDENDEEAFSHFGVDKFGKQIAIPISA